VEKAEAAMGVDCGHHDFPVHGQAAKAGLNTIAGGKAALGFPDPDH